MPANNFNINGLTDAQATESADKNGKNILRFKKENALLKAIKSVLSEPIILLLLVASAIYFISGDVGDGIFLVFAVVFEAVISLYQVSRSRNAMAQLKTYTQPVCKVIRNGEITEIASTELVLGDAVVIEEGTLIPADGTIVYSNDFSVNESILTGESLSLSKDKTTADNSVYGGTMVATGMAVATLTAIGNNTRLGKIGKSLEEITEEPTPLEKQINNFVKKMMIVGSIVFVIVWAINFAGSRSLLDSLLKALTLAMSILPEEIPVALTTFMALGAWRMLKMGIVVKQMKTVETLGSATVICTDKTGTITENKMSLAKLYLPASNAITDADGQLTTEETALLTTAMWASEPAPFDPMEIALHSAYAQAAAADLRPEYEMVHEYPLSGKPPMMTHIFRNRAGTQIIAAKGAPEAIMHCAQLSDQETQSALAAIDTLAKEGYRLLAVGDSDYSGDQYAAEQQEIRLHFRGIVAFYDPPKAGIAQVLDAFYQAGIRVKIITGDNAATTASIARQIGFRGYEQSLTGDEIVGMTDAALQAKVGDTQLFTRMFPEAKLKIINALKANNEIVAMTGDGVNDGPALKAAHIGIAMGKKGTEIARQAASLILQDDDLQKMVDAIAMGRRIYANLKKAIRYIISIHIPIILAVFLPLVLGWRYPNLFSPVHIIFLEIVMGPTCSIIFENEPMEQHTMSEPPRAFTTSFFNWPELATSLLQGAVITAGVLLMYQYGLALGYDEALTRTMVFTTLITANIFLTLVNRSFYYPVWTTLRYHNNLVPLIIGITLAITASLIYFHPFAAFFGFSGLAWPQLAICAATGFASVLWYEVVKWRKRIAEPK